MGENINKLNELIKNSKNIVFFTGAGVSTDSGIPDFRSEDGLYNCLSEYGVDYETILSSSFFYSKPEVFYDFYKKHMVNLAAKPNYFHKFVADLEKSKNITVVTQNIDGLHSLAGSTNVLELHGTIYKNKCLKCNKSFDLDYIMNSKTLPICDKCGGLIKPEVVLYEESLDMDILYSSINAISKADLLIIAGTSLKVQPAASLIQYYNGRYIVVINKEKLYINSNNIIQINDSVVNVAKKLKL